MRDRREVTLEEYKEAVINSFGFGKTYISLDIGGEEGEEYFDLEYIAKKLDITVEDAEYLGKHFEFLVEKRREEE